MCSGDSQVLLTGLVFEGALLLCENYHGLLTRYNNQACYDIFDSGGSLSTLVDGGLIAYLYSIGFRKAVNEICCYCISVLQLTFMIVFVV